MKEILIVKLTSMGDVIQALPVVADLKKQYPGVAIDWAVDAQFAAFPLQHPGIRHVFAFPLRGHKKRQKFETLRALFNEVCRLREHPYDAVIDCHGMIKSALVSWLSCSSQRYGFAKGYLGENNARFFYDHTVKATDGLPRVERLRDMAAQSLAYRVSGVPEFGLQRASLDQRLSWLPERPYLVFLHATTEAAREWPEQNWVDLGLQAQWDHLEIVLPWGNTNEKARAERLAKAIPNSRVAPKMDLNDCCKLIACASAVVGVDTGLTHLAYAYGVPTVGLLANNDPAHVSPYWLSNSVALGSPGVWPTPSEVSDSLVRLADI